MQQNRIDFKWNHREKFSIKRASNFKNIFWGVDEKGNEMKKMWNIIVKSKKALSSEILGRLFDECFFSLFLE